MNPRRFCRERSFHKALLLTYSFDPVFFEQIVLPDLWAGRTSDILVIGDKNQVTTAIESAAGRLWHLGKRYLLASAEHAGSFHPKLLLRLGTNNGAVMIGSGNLTSCGWNSNRELGCAWMLGPGHADSGSWLIPLLDEVITWCASNLEKDAVRRMKDVPWLGMQSATSSSPAPVLYSSGGHALAPALAERWVGRQFSELRIFTGSTDESGAFLRWAHRTFGITRAVIALTPTLASFSLDKLADLPVELRLIPVAPASPMHAKLYFFDGPAGSAAVMGSPNCSAAAWLLPPDAGGNIETALVFDTPVPADFHDLLEIFASPSSSPEDVLTKMQPASVEGNPGTCPYDLVGLRWYAPSRQVMALIAPPPEPDTRVMLLLGVTEIAMKGSTDGNDCWYCEIPNGIDFTSAQFASIRMESGEQQWQTRLRWIDHLAELHQSTQTGRFLEPIEALEHSASLAEQRRILTDLHEVAQALFSDSATFKDMGFSIATEAPQNSDSPAPPVDPVELIRNLEEDQEPLVALSRATPGSLSLTGILRLLFDAERAVTDAEVAADDERLDEGQPAEPAPTPDSKKKGVPDETQGKRESVDARLQSRLAAQIETFLQNMSKRQFAESCTATQLIQASSFPLAVALRGQPRGWVSDASAEQWALRVFSLLFKGKTATAPGLLRIVEQRYIDHGQAEIFRELVGDGTLWMVMIATLGNSTWQGLGAFMDKALALREVFRAPQLIASAQVSRLAGLLGKLRIDDARAYVSVVAPTVSELLGRIEDQIRPVWEREARAQAGRAFAHQAGDLLWRENVGWAVCLRDAMSWESVEVRLRGERKKIGAGYYANISDLATRSDQLSELLADLRARLETSTADRRASAVEIVTAQDRIITC